MSAAKTSGTAETTKKSSGSKLHDILIIVISMGLIVVLQVGFIFFLFALLPSLVAFFIDETRSKHVYKSVLACNLSGMLPTLAMLTKGKSTVASLQVVMGDPMVWLMVYGAAAGGWMLVWVCRAAAYVFVTLTFENRLVFLDRARVKMVEEWGSQVKRLKR